MIMYGKGFVGTVTAVGPAEAVGAFLGGTDMTDSSARQCCTPLFTSLFLLPLLPFVNQRFRKMSLIFNFFAFCCLDVEVIFIYFVLLFY